MFKQKKLLFSISFFLLLLNLPAQRLNTKKGFHLEGGAVGSIFSSGLGIEQNGYFQRIYAENYTQAAMGSGFYIKGHQYWKQFFIGVGIGLQYNEYTYEHVTFVFDIVSGHGGPLLHYRENMHVVHVNGEFYIGMFQKLGKRSRKWNFFLRESIGLSAIQNVRMELSERHVQNQDDTRTSNRLENQEKAIWFPGLTGSVFLDLAPVRSRLGYTAGIAFTAFRNAYVERYETVSSLNLGVHYRLGR